MLSPGEIEAILDRIASEAHTEADLNALRRYLLFAPPRNVVQVGKYNVHIGQGQDIQIGDRIYRGFDAEKLREVLRQALGEFRPQPGVPFQAPSLPSYFVPRPEVSESLKAQLLADKATSGALVVSAIHGLGGIGKSTLAAALAHDSDVQARFPDGVLWATLGQQPEILSRLMGWIQASGDYGFRPTTVEAATAHLRTLLHAKAALLVVDDAWDPVHVRPFLVGGSRCRVLVTTREAVIAKAVGAALYDLDVMTPEQALALLAGRLGRDLAETERERALELAQEVGYLPLALELAAAQVADGVPWDELLADLRAEVARLETLELPEAEEIVEERERKRLSLLASFYLSLRRLPEVRREAFAWLGVLPEDVTLTPAMMATVWRMEARQARDTLRYLRGKALLLPGVPWPDGTPTYRLHDLLHDLARRLLVAPPEPARAGDLPGLGLTLEEAHALLLEQYRARTREGLWHTLPDDGYIHAHLTWHMEKAGRVDEIHALLREETAEGRNGWYEARERLGQTAGYLADVARAWRLAEEEFAVHHSPSAIGFQCRYALITVSLNTLARNIPPALLAALVEKGVWTPAQGLAYARAMPDTWWRSRAIEELFPYLSAEMLRNVLASVQIDGWSLVRLIQRLAELGYPEDALAAAREIRDADYRSKALAELVPHLSGDLRENAVRDALAAARELPKQGIFSSPRVEAMVKLVPYLPEELQVKVLHDALAVAKALPELGRGGKLRAEALAELIPHLPEELLQEALTAALEIEDPKDRTETLTKLALRSAEIGLPEESLTAVREIQGTTDRAEALSRLASRLAELGYQEEVLAAVREIQDANAHSGALARLVPRLSEELQEQALRDALSAAREIKSADGRAKVLAEIALHLSESSRGKVLRDALAAAREIKDASKRFKAMVALLPNLPRELQEQTLRDALSAARGIEDTDKRYESLQELLPHLSGELREQALRDALTTASEIEDTSNQSEALAKLVPHLPQKLRDQVARDALAAAQKIWAEIKPLEALAESVPYLSGNTREAVIREVLSSFPAIALDVSKARRILHQIVPYLPGQLLEEAVAEIRATYVPTSQIQILLALARGLPEEQQALVSREVLAVIRGVQDPHQRKRAIKVMWDSGFWELSLVREKLNEVLDLILDLILEIPVPLLTSRDAFDDILSYFPFILLTKAQLIKVLSTILKVEDSNEREHTLAILAAQMAEIGEVETARSLLYVIESPDHRVRVLAALAPRWPEEKERLSLFKQALDGIKRALDSIEDRLDALDPFAYAHYVSLGWEQVQKLIQAEALGALVPCLPESL